MAFDGLITKAVIQELKPHLIGGKVNKIFEPTKNDIVISLYNSGNNYALSLSANPETCRIGLTTYTKPNPQVAPNFCMLLRKYLTGAKLIDISNMDLERTVQLKFEAYNELNDLVIRKLFIEIMSRQSNIVLTNENNIIIDTLKHIDSANRELLPAHEFEFTPINRKSFLELTSSVELFNIINGEALSKAIPTHFIGFSKPFILYTLKYLDISDTDYSQSGLEKFFDYVKEIISSFGTSNISLVEFENGYTLALKENKQPLNINFFIDDFYFSKEKSDAFVSSRNNLLRIISGNLKKVSKKLQNINYKLEECSNMDIYKLYGELLTANLYKFKDSPNLEKVELENYYDNNNLITIPLDKSISVHKNIDKYFKKYNKLKNALTIVSGQKLETEKELDYIQSIVFSLENAKNLNDINEIFEEISDNVVTKKDISKKIKQKTPKKKQKSDEIDIKPITIDGYLVYIGKNNIQNDYLSLKFANKNDIWFHTQKIHGSHVLLRNSENLEIDSIPENVLFNCAKLAKENSKASSSLNVPVDFCLARYVKKASGAKPRNGSLY